MRLKLFAASLVLSVTACVSPDGYAEPVAPVTPEAAANPANWPVSASPPAISAPATEAAIDALLKRMSLEQKVGQLVQADISAITPADLEKYPLGSILAGGNSGPYGDERASADKWALMVGEYRAASRKSGAGIPVIFGVDAVHGHSNLPGATIFPHNIGLGAARDPEMIGRIGAATAAEIAGSGIEWTFAPTLAVPQDMRWGRTYEGYAADPALVAAYARTMTSGLQGSLVAGKPLDDARVAATAKHFLADGGTADGRDQGDARISEAELVAKHAQGYPAAIDAGALTVMVSFSSWNGAKNHGNATLMTDVLKKRMGFEGLVVGDWNGHGQIPGCSATDCPAAINAGLDMFMAPDSWKGVFESTLAAAKDGRISAVRMDDAVRRILRVKYKLGLMGNALTHRGNTAAVGAPAHLELAREAVAKSLVLLKNNDGVLPIRNGQKVLIAGPGADNMAMQAGGWTITWQGTDTRADDFPNGQSIGRAIADAVAVNGGNAAISSEGAFTEKPDVAVVVLGEKPYAEFEGDVPNLAFQTKSGEDEMIAHLKSQGIKVVVVFLSGRPMFAGKLINQADAFVAAWLPGTQGRGVADVLVAGSDNRPRRDFTGRLPFAWPANALSPIDKPLFASGYGMDYTNSPTLLPVNENAGVDLSSLAQNTTYLLRGKVPAPWHLGIDGAISTRAVDLSAQEDARQFSWNADGMFAINGPVVNLRAQLESGLALAIDWRIDQAVKGPVRVSFGEATLDVTAAIAVQPTGVAQPLVIPLRCFSEAGAKLGAVGSPLRIAAPKGFVATIRNVRIDTAAAAALAPCPPKLP
jgi:beta-glucosidase